jgi:hypothetical protein
MLRLLFGCPRRQRKRSTVVSDRRRMDQLCGIVDHDSSLELLQFEVIEDRELTECRLVETSISGEAVLFQIIEGLTHEEVVQQKDKYSYVRANLSARQPVPSGIICHHQLTNNSAKEQ